MGDFDDGVAFVDLALAADAESTMEVLATALGVHDQPQQTLAETVCAVVHARRVLIVLDNCERVIDAEPLRTQDRCLAHDSDTSRM